ncbi:MAG: hypothetical protein JKY37_11405, partial [Nannocystaceae bacterium]|nr:hypothetical protein [Nannocystaceae bacterium]
FVQLKDSYTDKVTKLSRKMAEGKASKKDMKFIQKGAVHVVKLNDLKGQVRAATMPAMQAGWVVTTGSMTTMSTVAGMIRTRRQMEMEWTEGDYELVQGVLARQGRREALAAISIGLLATYQAVITVDGDPKMLEDVATATLAALPIEGKSSVEQAKAYVANFDANAEMSHQLYEQQMRKTFGDAEFEAKYKAQIDSTFMQLKSASSAMSATERMAQVSTQYEADLVKCAKGEDPGPSTMVGPGKCKEAQENADGSGELSPKVLAGLLGGGDVDAKGLASKGLAMVLDKLPGGGAIKRALEGVRALRRGDPSMALRLAADLIPMPGPAKMALAAAAKLTENLPAMRKKAKKLRKAIG